MITKLRGKELYKSSPLEIVDSLVSIFWKHMFLFFNSKCDFIRSGNIYPHGLQRKLTELGITGP